MAMLDTPVKVGSLTLANRIAMPPMARNLATPFGEVTSEVVSYYGEKSSGGSLGLLETEHLYVRQDGKASPGQLGISDDGLVAGLTRVADAIHANGVPAIAQLSHAGAKAAPCAGDERIAPSAVASPLDRHFSTVVPRAMGERDIDLVSSRFVMAAHRAKRAGFDGVELHAAHGYLLGEFLSPLTNRRCDMYGAASVTSRLAVLLGIVQGIRVVMGPDFVVSVRLGADYAEGGTTVEDAALMAHVLGRVGVDLVSVSGGLGGYVRPGHDEPGWFSDLARAIKERTSVPVMLTGGIRTADQAEALLEAGVCDIVGVGRQILNDSTWAADALARMGRKS